MSPGDFLYKADDVCRSLYIVDSGVVEVVKMDADIEEYVVSERARRIDGWKANGPYAAKW